jgi:chlorite dismutase
MNEPASRPKARDLNEVVRYTMWSVFRLRDPLGDAERAPLAAEVAGLFDELSGKDVVVRGTYDVGGLRADADLMVWWHAASAGEEPRAYVCVYPFVRSYEWYLLPDTERRAMLAEHGMMARDYPDVRANTVASFALGDYEWILAFEADELHRIVDLMRHLRGSAARRHVREEVPFYTGRRKPVEELVAALP